MEINLIENEMSEQELQDIKRFAWNSKCSEDQLERMSILRDAGAHLCHRFIALTPSCADRSAAIRYLRLAVMQCNLAIAHENME